MTTSKNIFAALSLFPIMMTMTTSGCKKDEITLPPNHASYDLKVKDVLGIYGTVVFIDKSNSTTVEITLNGADQGSHPAHIHLNSAMETGAIAITLNPVDATGKSITSVTKLDNNNTISYAQLIAFDGYINVHESSTNLGVLLAQTDIGGNALTGRNKSYNLTELDSLGVSGVGLFEERKNGNSIVTLSLTGTISGAVHPAHIHLGSVATVGGGPITATLNSVDGTTGRSSTNIRKLDNSTSITYDNWLVYDGYINVHESSSNLASILCQGNIGTH